MIQLQIPKMKCAGCAATITRIVKNIDPGARIEADPATKLVNVESNAESSSILAALASAGYPAELKPGLGA